MEGSDSKFQSGMELKRDRNRPRKGRGGGRKVGEDEIKPKGTKGGVSLVARKKKRDEGGEKKGRKTKTTTERKEKEKTRGRRNGRRWKVDLCGS